MPAHTQGPVPLPSESYIQRPFETDIVRSVAKRNWVLLLGPRQFGKTSALLRCTEELRNGGFFVAYLDLQKLPPTDKHSDLLSEIAVQIRSGIDEEDRTDTEGGAKAKSFFGGLFSRNAPSELKNTEKNKTWTDVGTMLEDLLGDIRQPVLLIIDEAASIQNEEIRNSFYGQIRSLKNDAAVGSKGTVTERMCFVFSGAFRPETLVDDANSPFNVCEEIETIPLTFEDVSWICGKLLKQDDADNIARKVWESVGGQPYLVQKIIAALEDLSPDQLCTAIDEVIENLDRDTGHIASIFSKVVGDDRLSSIVRVVIKDGAVLVAPADHDQRFLRTLGLLKKDGRNLIFANSYYERIAKQSVQLIDGSDINPDVNRVLHKLPQEDYDKVTDPNLREIVERYHRGAVIAYNEQSYRLALLGIGSAYEALLVYWLGNTSPADVQKAVGKVAAARGGLKKTFSGFEDQNDPATWRLVNLVSVGRVIASSSFDSEADIPDSIRNWRNITHAKVILQNYQAEDSLEPSAAMAETMFRRALNLVT